MSELPDEAEYWWGARGWAPFARNSGPREYFSRNTKPVACIICRRHIRSLKAHFQAKHQAVRAKLALAPNQKPALSIVQPDPPEARKE